jgi:transposase
MDEETRKQAILRYVNGESPKSIYTDLKRSKYWFFKWLKRFRSGDLDWYKDRPKVPMRSPSKTSESVRQLIISIRKQLDSEPFAQVGVSAVKWELSKLGIVFPSDSTIKRILREEGLVKKNFLHSEGSRLPLLQGTIWLQQHSLGGPYGPALHKRRWQVLLAQCDGSMQPSYLH